MQGFVQIENVKLGCETTIASAPATNPMSLAIISRRSIERPGLRYQRRGINANGGVANFVETEFLLSCQVSLYAGPTEM